MCSLLVVKSVFLILCMNEMSQISFGERFDTDTGDRCWRVWSWWWWKIDTELCLCSTLTGILNNKHPYYKSSVFSVCLPHNSSCCDISKHSETKIPCLLMLGRLQEPGGCFTNVSRALQDILSKFVYCRNHTSYENFKLKLCTCAQSPALGTRTKFQLEILTINVISGMVYFHKIILESSRNVSETTPRASASIPGWYWPPKPQYSVSSIRRVAPETSITVIYCTLSHKYMVNFL